MLADDLLAAFFAGQPHPLAGALAEWLGSSRRFAAFADTYRAKIRKKLRAPQEHETLLDLRLELETAYLLLRERALSLAYEPQGCGQPRCPDFAASFTTSVTFMVEVTRLRAAQPVAQPTAAAAEADRLVDTIAGKLGQLAPQRSNVLVVGHEVARLTHADIQAAMIRLQQRAERNDPTLWQRHHFRDRAAFFALYGRLSEVLIRTAPPAPPTLISWRNPQARHPLPAKVRTTLLRSHTLEVN